MTKTYIIYDGRAVYDVDRASIIECVSDVTEKELRAYFRREYANMDAVCFEYDNDGDKLINGEMMDIRTKAGFGWKRK